jgi:hypothetical protein
MKLLVDSLEVGNGEIRICCTKCKERGKPTSDEKYKLYVNFDRRLANCYRCGFSAKGAVFSELLREICDPNTLFKSAIQRVVTPKAPTKLPSLRELFVLDSVSREITVYSFGILKYLASRGFGWDDIHSNKMRVGTGDYAGRVIIPTFDVFGNCVYLTARSYDGREPKYKNPESSHKTLSVHNIHNVKEGSVVVITEGVFSCISASKKCSDLPVVFVASHGKYLSDRQCELLRERKPSRVLLMLDDEVSKDIVNRNAKLIYDSVGCQVLDCQIPSGCGDPDEAPDNIVRGLVEKGLRSKNGVML